MIYTDGIHIVSDKSVLELHKYCEAVGIKRCWFHKGSRFPHYDIPKRRRGQEFMGARVVTSREIVALMKAPCPACSGTGMIHQNCIMR